MSYPIGTHRLRISFMCFFKRRSRHQIKKKISAITISPMETPTPAPVLVALDDERGRSTCDESEGEGGAVADIPFSACELDSEDCGLTVVVDSRDVDTCATAGSEVIESVVGEGTCSVEVA